MGKTSIALVGLLLLAVGGMAQTIPIQASISQATNMVSQDAFMSPARMADFWNDIGIPYVLANGGGGGPTNGLTLSQATALMATNPVPVLSATTAGTATFAIGTNFLNQNMKFVDITNGSDANDGSVNYPWQTLTGSATNTPAGWTIDVAAGLNSHIVHGSPAWYTVTDFLVNYYLESGSVVHFYPNASTFTNNISGNGTVAFVDIGDISDNTTNNIQVCNILCSDFQFITTCGQAFGVYYNIYCDTCEGDCFAPAIPEPYEYLNVYCKSTANLQGLGENESAVGIKLYAANIILSDPYSLGYGLSTNSLLSAKTAYLTNVNFSVSTGAGGFVWDVGKTYCNGVDPNFPAGMIFIGNPSFDHSITAPNCIGSYQVNGVQYGNIGRTTNYQATNLVGIVSTNNLPMAQLGGSTSTTNFNNINVTNTATIGSVQSDNYLNATAATGEGLFFDSSAAWSGNGFGGGSSDWQDGSGGGAHLDGQGNVIVDGALYINGQFENCGSIYYDRYSSFHVTDGLGNGMFISCSSASLYLNGGNGTVSTENNLLDDGVGNATFAGSVTATSFTGNGGGLTNIPSTSITGGMTTNLQFTDTALLRTNTLYFTNGILMRVTSP